MCVQNNMFFPYVNLTHCGLIWCQRTCFPLVQVTAWFRQVTNQSLNWCWLILSEVLWHSPGQFHRKCSRYIFLHWFWKLPIKGYTRISLWTISLLLTLVHCLQWNIWTLYRGILSNWAKMGFGATIDVWLFQLQSCLSRLTDNRESYLCYCH